MSRDPADLEEGDHYQDPESLTDITEPRWHTDPLEVENAALRLRWPPLYSFQLLRLQAAGCFSGSVRTTHRSLGLEHKACHYCAESRAAAARPLGQASKCLHPLSHLETETIWLFSAPRL